MHPTNQKELRNERMKDQGFRMGQILNPLTWYPLVRKLESSRTTNDINRAPRSSITEHRVLLAASRISTALTTSKICGVYNMLLLNYRMILYYFTTLNLSSN